MALLLGVLQDKSKAESIVTLMVMMLTEMQQTVLGPERLTPWELETSLNLASQTLLHPLMLRALRRPEEPGRFPIWFEQLTRAIAQLYLGIIVHHSGAEPPPPTVTSDVTAEQFE